jgi:plastocyanin
MPAVRNRSLMPIRALLALALIGALASVMTLLAPFPTRAAQHAVQVAGMAFSPATLTITAGDTVTWTNGDDRRHTVTSNDGAFDSGNLDAGASFSFTFTTPGTYTYRCDYHPEMQATIVVEPAAAAAPAPANQAPSGGTDAGAGGAAAQITHAPGTHDGSQPDTALPAPVSTAWLSPLLVGLGLVALAFAVFPPVAATVEAEPDAPRA